MKFSINPVSIYKIIAKQRGNSKSRVSEYLELIAVEARDLADIWERIGDDIIDKGFASLANSEAMNEFRNVIRPKNARPYYRLNNFYEQISIVTHGKVDNQLRETFINHLGRLIFQREVTLESYKKMIRKCQVTCFIDESNSHFDFEDFSALAQGLNKEAAALEVLAKTIKAM